MKSFTGDTQFGEYNTVYRTVTPENIPDTRVSESNLPYFHGTGIWPTAFTGK